MIGFSLLYLTVKKYPPRFPFLLEKCPSAGRFFIHHYKPFKVRSIE